VYTPNLKVLLGALLTFTASATPISAPSNNSIAAGDTTFNLFVLNKCGWTKSVATYEVTSDFQMIQSSNPQNVAQWETVTIPVDFYSTGMRLSGHAEKGTAWQWNQQALFEWGYSSYNGQEGTAYDLSSCEEALKTKTPELVHGQRTVNVKGRSASLGIVLPVRDGRVRISRSRVAQRTRYAITERQISRLCFAHRYIGGALLFGQRWRRCGQIPVAYYGKCLYRNSLTKLLTR
jgi:hypothetical protein